MDETQLLMMKDEYYGRSAMHEEYKKKNIPLDTISMAIEVGGREVLMAENMIGYTALHSTCTLFSKRCKNQSCRQAFYLKFEFLVKEYISTNIDGEFGIRRLFNVARREEVQDKIYENREQLLSVKLLDKHQQPPILHDTVIISKALYPVI